MPLEKVVKYDSVKREYNEFILTDGDTMATTWMAPFIGPAELQIRIVKDHANSVGVFGTIDCDCYGVPVTQWERQLRKEGKI